MHVKLDGFGLFVEDMPAMVRFYRDVLGFAIREPETMPWGQRTCYVADPEGNLIEIAAFAEQEEHNG